MIARLILKDIKAYRFKLLQWSFVGFLFTNFLFFEGESSIGQFLMSVGLMAAFMTTMIQVEYKLKENEVFDCSLPVTRQAIVIAKYLTSIIVFIVVLFVWAIATHFTFGLHSDVSFSLEQLWTYKSAVLLLLTVFFHISLFYPGFFVFRKMGAIFTLFLSMFLPLILFIKILRTKAHSYIPHFVPGDFELYGWFSSGVVILAMVSVGLSLVFFKKREF